MSPPSGVANVVTGGYYAYIKWYQPKRAATYDSIIRFGAEDWVGVYCMQGASSTAYFSTASSAMQLSGALTLTAATGIFLGTATAAIF